MQWRALALLLVMLAGTATAQPALVLDEKSADRIELRGYLGMLRDPTGTLDADAVRSRSAQFQSLSLGSRL